MRSYFLTFLLILTTAVAVGLSAMYFGEGNLSRVFGQPVTPIGQTLYDFEPDQVTDIYLAGNGGVSARCQHGPEGWRVVSPWKDRMDPRAAQQLMNFVLGTKVEGAIPTDKLKSSAIASEDGQIALRFADSSDEPLAKFLIGHKTPWLGTDSDSGELIPTVFVAPRDRSRKDYVYACTDPEDIHKLLGNGFRKLRDHHPFLFHPNIVAQLRLKSDQGELTLKQVSKGQWVISKPLDLKSDPAKVKTLLQGLYDLEAVRVFDREEVTLPAEGSQNHQQIAFKFHTSEEEVVLDIYPPQTEVSQTVMAVVSDRPNTVFELPWIKAAGPEVAVSLTSLPLSVNSLRDPTLTSVSPTGIRSIDISPATGEDVSIARATPKDRFLLKIDGRLEEPNETALYALIKSVSEAKVSEFISDTATDLSTYGLNQPFLILRFIGFDDSKIELRFGQTKDGSIHVIREGTNTVVRIEPTLLNLIPTHLWEWRNPQIWNIALPDVLGIARNIPGQAPLQLLYDFSSESWVAKRGEEDVSAELNRGRADQLLKRISSLQAGNWLPPANAGTVDPFANPDLTLELLVKELDDEAQFVGVRRLQLAVSKQVGKTNVLPNPFLLDPQLIEQLTVDLFEFD